MDRKRLLALVLATLFPGLAHAAGDAPAAPGSSGTRVYGSTTTIVRLLQVTDPADPRSKLFQAPLYEYLTVGADDVGVDGFSVHVTGFGVANITRPALGERFSGDVLAGTVSWRERKGRIVARLGRQFLFDGAGNAALMDGAYVRVRPWIPVDVSAWGGFVPYPRFDYAAGRFTYGARVAYNPWDWGRIGVSFSEERDGGNRAFSSIGVDYAFRRFAWMDLAGFLQADLLQKNVQEARNSITFVPHRDWWISVDHAMAVPSARIPRTSIFSVFTNSFYHAAGGEVTWRGAGELAASAYGRYFRYGDGGGSGYQAGLKPTLAIRKGLGHQVGLEVSRLASPTNAYTQARAFGIVHPFKRAELTLDIDNYFYDHDVKGYGRSHIVGLTGGYEVFAGARVQGDLYVTVNPDYRQQVSGLLKFAYAFGGGAR